MSGASKSCVVSNLKLSWNIWGEGAACSFLSDQLWECLSLTVKVQQMTMIQLHSWQFELQILAKLETLCFQQQGGWWGLCKEGHYPDAVGNEKLSNLSQDRV